MPDEKSFWILFLILSIYKKHIASDLVENSKTQVFQSLPTASVT